MMRTEKEIEEKFNEISEAVDNDKGNYRINEAIQNALAWTLDEFDDLEAG